MKITIRTDFDLPKSSILALYEANKWSSAKKPEKLYQGLMNSHDLVTAWHEQQLVGLGNALTDGYLVVYYPHLLVHPDYQGQGIGKKIVATFQQKYARFHQQILVANRAAIPFYESCGFQKANVTQSMWIYGGMGDEL